MTILLYTLLSMLALIGRQPYPLLSALPQSSIVVCASGSYPTALPPHSLTLRTSATLADTTPK